jgi:hypothetical protein
MLKRKAWRWGKRSFFSVSKKVKLYSLDGICVGSGFPNVNILRSLPQKYTIRQKLINLSLSSERRFPPVSSKIISFGTYVIGWVLADVAKRKRFIISLPVNGQRTRSNAKTMRVLKIQPFDAIVRRLGTARRCVGRQMGSDAKQKKIKAKLRPKLQKSKANVKKKPVIRSRDTKKSV